MRFKCWSFPIFFRRGDRRSPLHSKALKARIQESTPSTFNNVLFPKSEFHTVASRLMPALSNHLVGSSQNIGRNPSKENPKSEYRNPKQTHAKAYFEFPSNRFRVLRLIVSICFELRISNFGFQTDHRITRSALAKTVGGMVNPICFAAFRLITNSNFFGCSTGRSAGLAPLRILST